jgi:GntR family transcriptional regulator
LFLGLTSAPVSASFISTMIWTIDHDSSAPLQTQIVGCVRRGIASGDLSRGEQLPPAAELAEALGVNRNTVLAAYRDLRNSGILEFRRGRGARVSADAGHQAKVEEALDELLRQAKASGYPADELIRMIKEKT